MMMMNVLFLARTATTVMAMRGVLFFIFDRSMLPPRLLFIPR